MKSQLLDSEIWMLINKRTNWVPTFKRVEIVLRDEEEEERRR
jgi:hypothetical protein